MPKVKTLRVANCVYRADERTSGLVVDMLSNVRIYLDKNQEEVIPFFTIESKHLEEWFKKHLKINLKQAIEPNRLTIFQTVIEDLQSYFLKAVMTSFPVTFSSKNTPYANIKILVEKYISGYTVNNKQIMIAGLDTICTLGVVLLESIKFKIEERTFRMGFEQVDKKTSTLTLKVFEKIKNTVDNDPITFLQYLENAIKVKNPNVLSVLCNLENSQRVDTVNRISKFILEQLAKRFETVKKPNELENAYYLSYRLLSGNQSKEPVNVVSKLIEVIYEHRTSYGHNNFVSLSRVFISLLSDFEYSVTEVKKGLELVLGMSLGDKNFMVAIPNVKKE